MNSVTNRAFMAKKKMYKNPKTEVLTVNTERLMETPKVSGAGNASEYQDPINAD